MTAYYTLLDGRTHARLYATADEEHMGVDTLVNLALEAFLALREYSSAQYMSETLPPVTYNAFRQRLMACRCGAQYSEVAA